MKKVIWSVIFAGIIGMAFFWTKNEVIACNPQALLQEVVSEVGQYIQGSEKNLGAMNEFEDALEDRLKKLKQLEIACQQEGAKIRKELAYTSLRPNGLEEHLSDHLENFSFY